MGASRARGRFESVPWNCSSTVLTACRRSASHRWSFFNTSSIRSSRPRRCLSSLRTAIRYSGIGVKSRTHVMWFCIWVRGKRLGDDVEEGARTFKKASRNGSELRRRERCFFFGWRFAEFKRLWPELVERVVYGLKSVSEVPNLSQEAFALGEFLCGLFSAINAPAEPLPFDVPIEPTDKLLACEAEV